MGRVVGFARQPTDNLSLATLSTPQAVPFIVTQTNNGGACDRFSTLGVCIPDASFRPSPAVSTHAPVARFGHLFSDRRGVLINEQVKPWTT